MTDFDLYSPQGGEPEYLVGVDDCILLFGAIQYFRRWHLERRFPNLEAINALDRFLAYLDENPRFILSSYYERLGFNS